MSSYDIQSKSDRGSLLQDAERTLQLIASLPAPEGLERRIKMRLSQAPKKAAVISWLPAFTAGRVQGPGLRVAAAAAIVAAVAGGGWEIYSHIQVAPQPTAVSSPRNVNESNGFGLANARRTPKTLKGPVVASPMVGDQRLQPSKAAPRKSGESGKGSTRVPSRR